MPVISAKKARPTNPRSAFLSRTRFNTGRTSSACPKSDFPKQLAKSDTLPRLWDVNSSSFASSQSTKKDPAESGV